MTFSDGVTSTNFDSIKEALAVTLTDELYLPLEWVSLTLKSDVVVVTFLVPAKYKVEADYILRDLLSNYFVPAFNRAVSSSPSLASAGVVLDFADKTTCVGCGM